MARRLKRVEILVDPSKPPITFEGKDVLHIGPIMLPGERGRPGHLTSDRIITQNEDGTTSEWAGFPFVAVSEDSAIEVAGAHQMPDIPKH